MISYSVFGDAAILINYEQILSEEINQKIISLNQIIGSSKIPGILKTIPSYSSLTVLFDPFLTDHSELVAQIRAHESKTNTTIADQKTWNIPICYEPEFALDLDELSHLLDLRPEEIISLHSSKAYRVFMLGFLPGFVYLGSIDKKLECPRKEQPRLRVPAGSVGLAGLQTGIYPSTAPGGWQIIGNTAFPVFMPWNENPFPIKAGDLIKFHACSKADYKLLKSDSIHQSINLELFCE